jgi:Cys-rich repeat protein
MKATYDDATFFNGSEGVTATIDPAINAGTSFNVIIPHAAGAPNPVLFDHSDHTDIGFAPNAQIEFDGADAGTPGNFRNFEIHVDFLFAGDAHDFDTFMGAIQPETDMFNQSQGFNLAAVGAGVDHLDVVTNDITANAGGPYAFAAASLSLNLNGTSGGGSGFAKSFDWTGPGGALANSPGPNIAFGLAESGLSNTTDTSSIDLAVTELFTDFVSATDSASTSYANAAPSVLTAAGTNEVDFSITFGATFADADLAANALVAGFETVGIDFLYNNAVFLTGAGNVDLATLLGIFGGPGIFGAVARATDTAGATHILAFDVTVVECAVNSDCDDGAFCTGAETCNAGACVAGPGDPCLATSSPFCDESGDTCVECLADGDCDDGAFCTGAETCTAGACFSPGDPCSEPAPVCDESGDVCLECQVDGDCAAGEVCSIGVCAPSVPASSPNLRVALVVALISIACAAPWLIRRREH